MDRSPSSTPQHSTAVRTAGCAALDLLLSASGGESGESAAAPQARPVIPEASILRQPKNGLRTGGEPQAHPAPDAHSGYRSPLSQTELEPAGAGPPDLSVPAARRRNPPPQPRLEHRYNLHSDAWWLPISSRGDGLVQPLRAQLGTLQYHGDRLLPGGAQRRVPLRTARNLEFRPRLAIHLGRFPGSPQESRDLHQHGWPRPRARQRVHRTTVALAQ